MTPNWAKQPNEVEFVYVLRLRYESFLAPSLMMIDFCDDEATAIRGVEGFVRLTWLLYDNTYFLF